VAEHRTGSSAVKPCGLPLAALGDSSPPSAQSPYQAGKARPIEKRGEGEPPPEPHRRRWPARGGRGASPCGDATTGRTRGRPFLGGCFSRSPACTCSSSARAVRAIPEPR